MEQGLFTFAMEQNAGDGGKLSANELKLLKIFRYIRLFKNLTKLGKAA